MKVSPFIMPLSAIFNKIEDNVNYNNNNYNELSNFNLGQSLISRKKSYDDQLPIDF